MSNLDAADHAVAIVGMAGRFPGAKDIEAFWRNLRDGVESISFFSDEEMDALGLATAAPHRVKAGGVLDDVDLFDAAFFGFAPREAELMDPQQRLFLECAWAALEDAGHDPERYAGRIGVYAGASVGTYWLFNLSSNPDVIRSAGVGQILILNEKDYLPARVSYKLNLRGPSLNVQTACSTSLVAVHVACQSLLNGECDMALAGGVAVRLPQKAGYLYREGDIHSPDGHCRAFDAKAQGTVSGNGLGIVILKRLADALADGDSIRAVILGSAVNNDGALKIGFTAPSEAGQAAVVAEALAVAGVEAESVSYIEAHGTGTILGDPIEIAGLTQAFREETDKTGFCAIGSVKTNIGHLDVAAGVTGLIKTALALQHRALPPSLHFEQPNPRIDFAHSPFYVNAQPREWQSGDRPRRAGVSSLGIGGTNVHVIVEEAPEVGPSEPSRPWQLLIWSARTDSALEAATANLAAYLRQHPESNLADAAYTLQVGRKAFGQRRMLVCRDVEDAAATLEARDPERLFTYGPAPDERTAAFMFPGQSAQYVNMGLELYQTEPIFREHLDRCAELFQTHLGFDLRQALYPPPDQTEAATQQLDQTWLTQPALFAVEYALAQTWLAWGVRPQAMIGHSLGEYVAACLAGVFSVEEAAMLVAARGRLMHSLPGGAMLSVSLPEGDVCSLLNEKLSLAAVNGPSLCVVSGEVDAIDALQRKLEERGLTCRRLHTSHAFHSAMVEPILQSFGERVKSVDLQPPSTPCLSNVTGTWLSAQQATDPAYWVEQLRRTVRFAEGVRELAHEPDRILLEVGPGRTLSTLARQQLDGADAARALASMRHPQDRQSDAAFLLNTLGRLWLAGVSIDWADFYAGERRRRLPLPTYPFERQRYWIEPGEAPQPESSPQADAQPTGSIIVAQPLDATQDRHVRPNLATPYVAPRTEIEHSIVAVWRELLGIDAIGIHDNFFELRGHSLMATQLVARLREVFMVDVPLRAFMEAPSVARLAEVVEKLFLEKIEALPEDEARLLLQGGALQARDDESLARAARIAPLAFNQLQLWFLDQLAPGSPAYNISLGVRLKGSLDVSALERSLNEITRRHESLRTTFSLRDGQPVQIVAPALGVPLPMETLSESIEAERESTVQRLANEEARLPFDLARGPLLRARLLRLTNADHVLLVTLHHIIFDEWSFVVFVRELAALYGAFATGTPAALPALPVQYADFAIWQRDWLQSEGRLEAQLDYWQKQLDGLPRASELPTDRPRPPVQTFRGARLPVAIAPDLTEAAHTLSQEEGVSLFTTLLAAFKVLLHFYSKQRDIVIGTPVANRGQIKAEDVIGFFSNTLVLRTDLSGDPSFRELLGRVQRVMSDAWVHADLPFERLVEALRLERDASRNPVFQVMFDYQEAEPLDVELPGLALSLLKGRTDASKFDLDLALRAGSGQIGGTLEYNTDLFEASTGLRLLEHFTSVLRQATAQPDRRLSQLTPFG